MKWSTKWKNFKTKILNKKDDKNEKFNEEVKRDLFEYLKIENKSEKDIAEAINYLESYHFRSVVNWHDDNYYNDCNYGLLFVLCGLNGQRQEAMKEMMEDCFNVEVF